MGKKPRPKSMAEQVEEEVRKIREETESLGVLIQRDQESLAKTIRKDQEALARIAGWSQSDVDKSVNGFMAEQERRKPRKPISRGLFTRLLVRSRGNCENCNVYLRDKKVEVHHKNYDPTDPRETNLMVLCRDCHKKLTGPRPI
jgi:hypothetical protein